MNKLVEINRGHYGKRAILKGPWKADYKHLIIDNQVVEILLNGAKGWRGKDVDFLTELPHLLSIEIISSLQNDHAINELRELRAIHIESPAKTEIDFLNFPKIEKIAVYWRPGLRNLFRCETVRNLWLYKYPGNSLSDFASLKYLQRLELKNSRSLDRLGDVSGLRKLEMLGIYLAPKLLSLTGVQVLKNLRTLEIDTCRKIKDISPVRDLIKLRRFMFVDGAKIESIKALRNLEQLEEFFFYGSTNISDGDLSVLSEMPNLKEVAFQQRRHYNRNWSDFESTRD